ncbi:MAG: hypothetical protein GX410_04465 [Elusimicrobia bacterium]|nr:hypothetical protein [Elusimicrobiota bacterium]
MSTALLTEPAASVSASSKVREPRVLFTSVCKPIRERHGDAPSVGYELLHGQITRAQGIFSPRAVHRTYGLDFIAANLDSPVTVLHYPSKDELIRELKTGDYDYVGISFILATFHHMKEAVKIIREHSPKSRIILGGYGTVLPDSELAPYGDYICREEGVGFTRRLLGQPPLENGFAHPRVVSKLKLFSKQVSSTGMIFAGLGCPNGCDFCCTSHFFKRQHIKLLPTGKDVFNVVRMYLDENPDSQFTILDEDFLLDHKRFCEFRDEVKKHGKPLSIFAFASVKALSRWTIEELVESGIDGFWIGYEGTRSGYSKQQGRPVAELFHDINSNGGTILSSMILGFDYQNPEIIRQEFEGLMALRPSFTQFLIYGYTYGTPLADRVRKEGLLREEFAANPELTYKSSTGFASMIKHPTMSRAEVERLQEWCFDEDYQRLGPSIYRTIEAWYKGYMKHRGSSNPMLRVKAEQWAKELRKCYPVFLAGRLFGPNRNISAYIQELEYNIYKEIGAPTASERALSVAALAAAGWTKLKLSAGLFQHPRLQRNLYVKGQLQ